MSIADTWVRSPAVAWVREDSRVVVLHLERPDAVPLALEGSGSAIWLALDGATHTQAIIDSMSAEFDVPGSEIQPVVVAFLQDLRRRDLISLTGIGAPDGAELGDRGVRL